MDTSEHKTGFADCKNNKMKDERIFAYKIYANCRQQDCLTHEEIGPARADDCDCTPCSGQEKIINPPCGTCFVTIDNLKIKTIKILHKHPNLRCAGFWNIRIKFTFEYVLTFWDDNGCIINHANAHNNYIMKKTLFGSTGNNMAIVTDLYQGEKNMHLDAAPFILAKGKATALDAEIHHGACGSEVLVTIGLSSIITLFRQADLKVLSKGCYFHNECDENSALNPCEYFMGLDYAEMYTQ